MSPARIKPSATEAPAEHEEAQEVLFTDMVTTELTLAQKLALVLENIGRVPKRGQNEFHGYSYVTEADLVDHIRPLFARAGIVIIPSLKTYEYTPAAAQTRRGGVLGRTFLTVLYTITDGRETFEMEMPGEAMDDADKGVYKALTGSMKYALMKLCMVSTGDDPERSSKADDIGDVRIESSDRRAGKGGREEGPTLYQLQRISATMRERGLPRSILLGGMSQYLGELKEPEPTAEAQPFILDNLKRLTNAQAGELLTYLEGIEVDPEEPDAIA